MAAVFHLSSGGKQLTVHAALTAAGHSLPDHQAGNCAAQGADQAVRWPQLHTAGCSSQQHSRKGVL